MDDEVKHTPIRLPVSVGEAHNWRGENMGRGLEIIDATRLTVGNALPDVRPYIVEAVNNYDRLREVNADLLAALERIRREGLIDIDRGGVGHCAGVTFAVAESERAIARARGENVNA